MAEDTDLTQNINMFIQIISGVLRNIDVKFDDKEKPLMLLNSLLDSYEHLATILLLGRETLPELYDSLRPCKASS